MSLMLCAITIGICAITYHQRVSIKDVTEKTDYVFIGGTVLVTTRMRRFWRDFATARNLHGVLLVFAWWCGAGRVLTHKPAQWQRCYTQPALKMIGNASAIVYVGEHTEGALPPLFALYTLAPAMGVILIVICSARVVCTTP